MGTSRDGTAAPLQLDGFEQRRVEIGAGPIHVREAGSGEPLLFVHGWGVNGELWTDVASRLATSHRCIVPDLPFGSHSEAIDPAADLSPPGAAEIVAELIDALGTGPVTVVANDSGGAVSQILATIHPDRLRRLVLTNSDCLETFPPGTFKLLVRLLRMPGGMTLLTPVFRFRAIQRSPLAYGALSRTRIPDELLDSWCKPPLTDHGVRRDSGKFGAGMDPRHTMAAAEKLGGLRIPVLLAWGENDRFFPIELAERLEKLIPDGRLVRFQEGLTFLPLDEPERLADEITSFVASTSALADREA